MTLFGLAIQERFAAARQIADAVLFEGYVLYPYRASAAKNRMRWQFGVLVPPAWGQGSGEHHDQRTECLIEPRADANLSIELRFLHAQRRTVQQVGPDGGFAAVDALELPDRVLVPWDEGVEERVELVLPVAASAGAGLVLPFDRAEHEETEEVDLDGRVCGRLVRRRARIEGEIRVRSTEIPGPYRTLKLTVEVTNTSGWTPDPGADRETALPYALVSAHVLLGLDTGSFLSMTDPPEWATGAAASCTNLRTWPVLVGERDEVVLSSPIILEDHPQVAPESPGALYDATEIDEILALRTSALTEREKREARGTDARAGAAVDLVDSLPPEVWDRLHGTVRALRENTGASGPTTLIEPGAPGEQGEPGTDRPWWDPASDAGFDPAVDRVLVDGRSIGAGSRVRLRPGPRRTDAQDLFLHGRDALVEAVLHDVDGAVHLAVTVDGDPGADIRRAQGRFLYFQPDELTLLEDA